MLEKLVFLRFKHLFKLPLELNHCQQIILVTTYFMNSTDGFIYTYERFNNKWKLFQKYNGYIGKSGFAQNKYEGDCKTPIGIFTLGTAFGTENNLSLNMPYKKIVDDDIWVDDCKSDFYNTMGKLSEIGSKVESYERMNITEYKYGAVINYNTINPIKYNGSAIFIHCKESPTAGCVAVSENNMKEILLWLKKEKNPCIILSPFTKYNKKTCNLSCVN